MKIYFDTEFTGLQKNTTLISIGLISEDGRSFYAEFSDYDHDLVDDWIQENVIDNLLYDIENCEWKNDVADVQIYGNTDNVRDALELWLLQFDIVELCSDVCHYDMVLFIDIFGNAFSLPENVSASCIDINQKIYEKKLFGCGTLQQAFDLSREKIAEEFYLGNHPTVAKHNAFYDATIIRIIDEIIESDKH